MEVIWDKNAQQDLKQYLHYSKIYSTNKLENYINDLTMYVSSLSNSPLLGKYLYSHNQVEIRQLVFKMHIIFYYIKDDKIIIIKILHSSHNIGNIIENINKIIK